MTTVDMGAPLADGKCSTLIPAPGVGVVHAIKWQLQHRYMQVEAMAELVAPANDTETRQIAGAA